MTIGALRVTDEGEALVRACLRLQLQPRDCLSATPMGMLVFSRYLVGRDTVV